MDATRMSMGSSEASISSGERILSMDSNPSCTPTTMIISDTARPDRYSMRPCPKGWSGSGFFDALRTAGFVTSSWFFMNILDNSVIMN